MTDKNRTLKIVVVAVFAGASLFGFWRVMRSDHVAEPAPPASAASSAAFNPVGTSSAPQPEPDAANVGLSRPPKPQVYATATSPNQTIGLPLRPMDLEIFKVIETEEIKNVRDVFPGKPYRVTMLRDHVSGYIVVVTIDLDRNGKIDERWKLTPETVMRQASPDEKGMFLDDFTLRMGRWMPH